MYLKELGSLSVFLLFNFLISFIIYLSTARIGYNLTNVYAIEIDDIFNNKLKNYYHTIIESLFLRVLYAIYFFIDLPLNILRACFQKKGEKQYFLFFIYTTIDSMIDIIVFSFTFLSVCLYLNYYDLITQKENLFAPLLFGYFSWRFLIIIINKILNISSVGFKLYKNNSSLKELNNDNHESKIYISSFNRIIILSFFNIIELITIFSYMFYYFGFYNINYNPTKALFKTCKDFFSLNLPVKCFSLLDKYDMFHFIISFLPLITFIIFFIFFISNISNLFYKEKDLINNNE